MEGLDFHAKIMRDEVIDLLQKTRGISDDCARSYVKKVQKGVAPNFRPTIVIAFGVVAHPMWATGPHWTLSGPAYKVRELLESIARTVVIKEPDRDWNF